MFSQFVDHLVGDFIRKEEVVLLEPGLLEFSYDILDIFYGRSDKIEGLEMGESFSGLLSLLNEIDIVFVEFGLCIDN